MPRLATGYHRPTRSSVPPGKHLLVYDQDCGFCKASVSFIQRRSRKPVELVPFSDLPLEGLLTQLDGDQMYQSAHYITPRGREYHGGESVTRALRLLPGGAVFALLDLPGISFLRELAYALVANNRPFFSRLASRFTRGEEISCSIQTPDQD